MEILEGHRDLEAERATLGHVHCPHLPMTSDSPRTW
jgi:hypothetical protein